MEFLRPLTDLQVKEKEMARFECEISRENAKVCDLCGCSLVLPVTLSTFGLDKTGEKKESESNLPLIITLPLD